MMRLEILGASVLLQRKCTSFLEHTYMYILYIYIHVHARIYCAILWRYMALAKWILGGYPAVSTFDSLGLADVERLICRLST
jgi:hypothetical protein